MVSRVQMIIETLKDNPNKKFTAKELAKEFITRYPIEMNEKRNNDRLNTEDKLLTQLAAEIGGKRTKTAKMKCPNIITKDTPRPRIYFWSNTPEVNKNTHKINEDIPEINGSISNITTIKTDDFTEHDLYPMLIEYLKEDHGLYCDRIDEKTSKNSQGVRGNHWLHPDIVGLEPVSQKWNDIVRDCAHNSRNNPARLWSFEVKKRLTQSNVRESFFQTVSNSSWANFGYLVTAEINENIEPELQMLCSLHGIGVIILNIDSLFDSQILIPAREKNSVDWHSINRIAKENKDFYAFIKKLNIYYKTHTIMEITWNK